VVANWTRAARGDAGEYLANASRFVGPSVLSHFQAASETTDRRYRSRMRQWARPSRLTIVPAIGVLRVPAVLAMVATLIALEKPTAEASQQHPLGGEQ
jgi:hypothetical protein